MKRFISLGLCLLLLVMSFAACSKTDVSPEDTEEEMSEELREAEKIVEVDEDELAAAGETLEERLPLLKQDGWKEEEGSFVYTTEEEDCNGRYVITAKENVADVTVTFDYFSDTKEMVDFYKKDPGAAKAVCAYWYLRAVAVLDAPLGSENYSMIVGETEVVSGSMTYEEAEEAYDDYYED